MHNQWYDISCATLYYNPAHNTTPSTILNMQENISTESV